MSLKSGSTLSFGATFGCASKLDKPPTCGKFTTTTAAAVTPNMATMNWKKSVQITPVKPPSEV